MRCTIATGIDEMDNQLHEALPDSKIVNFREFLLKDCENTLIISEHLPGSYDFDKLLFEIRKKEKRIILLLDSEENPIFYKALKIGIYDILLDKEDDGISIQDIVHVYNNPKKISDFSKHMNLDHDNDIPSDKINRGGKAVGQIEKTTGNCRNDNAAVNKRQVAEVQTIEVEKVIYYSKQILTVWGNAEFAVELAYAAATCKKKNGFNVLLIDMDFIYPKVCKYLHIDDDMEEIERNLLFENIMKMVSNGTIKKEEFKTACAKVLSNLNVFASGFFSTNYEKLSGYDYNALLDFAYKNYELVIVSVNRSIMDKYTMIALENSNYNIIPINADFITIDEYNHYVENLAENKNIPLEKNRFVAYEYKPESHLSKSQLKEYWSTTCFGGIITYSSKRERYRNMNGIYMAKAEDRIKNEYMEILRQFNILPQKGLLDGLLGKFYRNV